MKRGTLVTIILFVALGAFLVLRTLGSQRTECEVTVEYEGRRNSARASGATEQEAAQQAQTTACGPIAAGMNATIACTNRRPVEKSCRAK
ncbi:MAG: hypothetical protein NW201_08745 [Gemmatimonadales bacterium]|nr:hypothetical protein [Gemmatimonadales bacterium]